MHEYNATEAMQRNVSALLVSWKANPIKLLLCFDHDRNGQIDMDEWEKARAEALHEVEVNHQMLAQN